MGKYDAMAEEIFEEIAKGGSDLAPIHRLMADIQTTLGTHVGVRRQRNDDRVGAARITSANGFSYQLSIVCDGVGSSELGNQAASLALASVVSFFARISSYTKPQHILADAIRYADEQVREQLRGDGTTTLSICAMAHDGELALASIGDSRIYSWIPHGDLIQLSVDDTIENELRDLKLKASALLNEKHLRGSLSQAIGEGGRRPEDLEIEVLDRRKIPPGTIVIASDGVWANSQIAFELVMKNSSTPYDAVRRALTSAAWLGGVDNASILIVAEDAMDGPPPAPEAKHTRVKLWLPTTTVVTAIEAVEPRTDDPTPTKRSDASAPPSSAKPVGKRKRKSKPKQPRKQDELPLDDEQDSSKAKDRVARDIDAGPDE